MGSEGTMGKAAVIGGDVVVYEEKKGACGWRCAWRGAFAGR
jgi:hypothetical protein